MRILHWVIQQSLAKFEFWPGGMEAALRPRPPPPLPLDQWTPPPPAHGVGEGQQRAEPAVPVPIDAAGGQRPAIVEVNDVAAGAEAEVIAPVRTEAQVIAPYDGQVAFAGPFRGYGLLLIIEHSEGYHTLLAGMARIDCTVGQRLLAGEPVGVMGQDDAKPALYVELRHNGQPVNPLPWLTAHKSKASG